MSGKGRLNVGKLCVVGMMNQNERCRDGRREGEGESELKEVRSGRKGSGETDGVDWRDSRVYPGGNGRSRIEGRL